MRSDDNSDLVTALGEAKRLLPKNLAAAEERARAILREHPDAPEALLLLAVALRKKGALESARTILETLTASQPQDAGVHYELGLTLSAAGDNRGATLSLKRAVDLDPNFAAAWHALGDQMTRLRSRKGADKAYAEYFYATVGDPLLRDAMTAFRADKHEEARALLLQHLETDPNSVNAIKLLGEIAFRQHRILRALQLFKRCIELAPDFTGARFRYATLLMTQNRPQEAIDEIDEILKREPDDPYYRNLKAACFIRMSDFERAAVEYGALLTASPNQPGAWLSYGHALKALGRREDCIAAYKRAFSLLPGFGDAYWSLANLKTYPFSEAEIDVIQHQLSHPAVKGENRAFFHFALGKAFDDARRYAESFQQYRLGNEIVRAASAYDAEEMTSQVRRSKALFTREFFAARDGWGCESRDPIFIVGLPRSGSTLVEQILASHAAIEGTTELRAMPYLAGRLGGKLKASDSALHYPQALADLDGEKLAALGEEYLKHAQMHRRLGRPFFTDKMPNNFAHIGMIHLILPNAKVVDVRRHPMACCWSNYTQHFGNGQEFSYALGSLGRYYCDYAEVMAHWDAVLPGKVHRVIYEDLIADPEKETRALFTYLDMPFEEASLRFYETDRLVRTPSAEQVRKPIFSNGIAHWKNFEPWLGPLKTALGFVLESYPSVPQFYDQLHATRTYSGWEESGSAWQASSMQGTER